jgi:hypothetical protein
MKTAHYTAAAYAPGCWSVWYDDGTLYEWVYDVRLGALSEAAATRAAAWCNTRPGCTHDEVGAFVLTDYMSRKATPHLDEMAIQLDEALAKKQRSGRIGVPDMLASLVKGMDTLAARGSVNARDYVKAVRSLAQQYHAGEIDRDELLDYLGDSAQVLYR